MKPRIKVDRFGPGWVCRLRGTRTATGDKPTEAYANWRVANLTAKLIFPTINPELIPSKEAA